MKIDRSVLILLLFCSLPYSLMAREWMSDTSFRRGLALSPLSPLIVQQGGGFSKTNTDTLRFRRTSSPPVWQAAQWWSKYDLAHTELKTSRYGRSYSNAGKQLALSRSGVLTMEIKTSTEYVSPRKEGEQWPHLLIQQDFNEPLRLSGVTQLTLSFSLRLLYCRDQMQPGTFQPGLHTAQSPFYLYLRNTNEQSSQFGASLWLGVPSFDFRDERLSDEPLVSWDIGTSMYIYQMPPRKLWGDISFKDNRWHTLRSDIFPYLKQAINYLHAKGLFLDTQLSDMTVTGMNFGWEVPGTFDAALQVKGFSLVTP